MVKNVIVFFLFFICLSFSLFAGELGDVNSDSLINIVDALMVAQGYVGLNPIGYDSSVADVNGDGSVNILDALIIAQFYVGLIPGFPGAPTPEPQNLITNGEFDNGTTGWRLNLLAPASATLSIDSTGALSGVNSLTVNIANGGTADWHIEVMQPLSIQENTLYHLYLTGKAASPRLITASLQMNHDPWTRIGEWQIPLTTTATTFGPVELRSFINDPDSRLTLALGNNSADVFLDNLRVCPVGTIEPIPTLSPGTPGIYSADAVKVRKWITDLTSRTENRVLSGQFSSHGNEVVRDFDRFITPIFDQTGKYPAMLSIDYEYAKIFTPQELSAANAVLINYWNEGGLISMNYTARNPFTGGDTRDLSLDGGELTDLIDPAKPVYTVWRERLRVIADALLELKEAGVVVLWRPMQEGNGTWFWFGHHPGYPEVWRDMRDYFQSRGLDNLLWVYSVADGWDPAWIVPNYPGDNYVDFVGNNIYKDSLVQTYYNKYLSFGKPVALTENGWEHDAAYGDNDNLRMIEKIRSDYPETRWFMNWHDWASNNIHSIGGNPNAAALMNDSWVITRDEVDWR